MVAGFFSQQAASAASCSRLFWSTFLMTGTSRPSGVSTAKPMFTYFLRMIALPLGASELLKSGSSLSRCAQDLEQQRQDGQLDAGLLCNGFLSNTERFQLGDIRRVELRHVRNVQPAAVQVGGADLHQAGHRHFFDFTEAAEVHDRNRRDARATGCASSSGRCFLGLLHHGLDVNLHVFLQDATVRTAGANGAQLDAEFTGQLTHGRAGVNFGARLGRCSSRCGSSRSSGSRSSSGWSRSARSSSGRSRGSSTVRRL